MNSPSLLRFDYMKTRGKMSEWLKKMLLRSGSKMFKPSKHDYFRESISICLPVSTPLKTVSSPLRNIAWKMVFTPWMVLFVKVEVFQSYSVTKMNILLLSYNLIQSNQSTTFTFPNAKGKLSHPRPQLRKPSRCLWWQWLHHHDLAHEARLLKLQYYSKQWKMHCITGVIILPSPNNARLYRGKSLKTTIRLDCLIPKKNGNLMTPA